MNSSDGVFKNALANLLVEIFEGPPGQEAFMLNPGDPGLLGQLEKIDAATASARPMKGKTTIASHVDHVHYGMTLINRWIGGEANPWATADWEASWKRTTVTEEQWRKLRDDLLKHVKAWQEAFAKRTEWDAMSAPGAISTVAHTAYHLGAIRQILAGSGKSGT